MSFLSKLFSVYLNDELEGVTALRPDDLESQYEELEAFEKKHDISGKEEVALSLIIGDFSWASEMKGFENGFKVAVRLFLESMLPTSARKDVTK